MPPKKAPAKKAPAAKKAGTTTKATAVKKATPKKATPRKPTGVVKKTTPSKTASAVKKSTQPPKSTRPKPTREIFGDILKSQSQLPYSPDTDVSGPVRMGNECERAAEIFRLYGGAAVEACGYDQTVLLNACLNLAWDESATSINADGGWRYSDGSQESRFGRSDLNHYADWQYWTRQMGPMERAMKEVMGKDQTERQRAFSAVGNQWRNTKYNYTEEEEKKWSDARELAMYYKNNPDEGHTVPGKKSSPVKKAAAATTTKKATVKKAAAATTTKKATVKKAVPASTTKKAPVKKSTTVKKSATTKSTTKAAVKKPRTLGQYSLV